MPWCLRTGIFRFRAIELKFKFGQNKLFNPKKPNSWFWTAVSQNTNCGMLACTKTYHKNTE